MSNPIYWYPYAGVHLNWDDKSSCADRRQRRLPLQLRDLYSRCANAKSEAERRVLQQTAWEMRKRWVQEWKDQKVRDAVTSGRVLARSKKLHPIKGMILAEGRPVSTDCEE